MTDLQRRINAFVELGEFFNEFCEYAKKDYQNGENQNPFFKEFDQKIILAQQKNGWFTKENCLFGIAGWAKLLSRKNLEKWLSRYTVPTGDPKTIALIMAGNIPLVGFHDFLAVVITGNKALVKLSSNDLILLPFIADFLIDAEPDLKNLIHFVEGRLEGFDAVIATGSNNTSLYFEHYFGKKPNIIRKNRNSVAVLTGNETNDQLQALGEDIFRYYGLGCRSVSKLFVPKGYDFDNFYKAIYKYRPIIDLVKYANNYDYNKAVYLMSEFKILDNGFLMLKEDTSFASPIATLFYETYDDLEQLQNELLVNADKLQCIVGNGVAKDEISFGKTQRPGLSDYADGVDTMEFLLNN